MWTYGLELRDNIKASFLVSSYDKRGTNYTLLAIGYQASMGLCQGTTMTGWNIEIYYYVTMKSYTSPCELMNGIYLVMQQVKFKISHITLELHGQTQRFLFPGFYLLKTWQSWNTLSWVYVRTAHRCIIFHFLLL